MIDHARHARLMERLAADPHAPGYHFLTPEGPSVCADPNGAIFWKGRYHLFYIFQDPALKTGPEFWQSGHCWGHASSADLLHWTFHPTALAPRPGDPEAAIYSGCALVNREGVPTLVYHGYGAGTCVATAADDGLIAWQKSPRNPVIPEPRKEGDPGWGVYSVFDPCVWLEGDTYHALLGGKVKPADVRDTAYHFTSPDLVSWTYRGPFYEPNPAWTGEGDDCACPKFFRLGERHALVCISHAKGMRCYLGDREAGRFVPREHVPLNWPGGACFAPETLLDGRGRRLVWGWALDQRRGWWEHGEAGVLTLPRVLSAPPAGGLRIEPAEELTALRREPCSRGGWVLRAGEAAPVEGLAGYALEIGLEAEVSAGARLTVKLRASPKGAEETLIRYDGAKGELALDASRSSLASDGWRPYPMDFWRGFTPANLSVQTAPLPLAAGEALRLKVFLDRSIVEVFANERLCLTGRVYPTRGDSLGVGLAAAGGDVRVRRWEAWRMEEVNRRTP